jgi:hypothetical protein
MTNTQTQLPLVWKPLWDAMRSSPAAWIPTTEEMYWDMLEALPPLCMSRGAFLMSEADHTNANNDEVYACFSRKSDEYFARYMTKQEFVNEVAA